MIRRKDNKKSNDCPVGAVPRIDLSTLGGCPYRQKSIISLVKPKVLVLAIQ